MTCDYDVCYHYLEIMRKISKKKIDLQDIIPVPVEKKIWTWLGKYVHYLLNFAIVCLVALCFYFILQKWSQHKTQKLIADYATKNTLEERVKWAEGSLPTSLNNLRGFIFLENASALLEQKNPEKAILYFQKARTLLKISLLKEQALAGYAFTNLEIQQFDVAETAFLELYKCTFKYLRAQALYALCLIAEKRNDANSFENYKKQLQTYDEGVDFLNRLDLLKITN